MELKVLWFWKFSKKKKLELEVLWCQIGGLLILKIFKIQEPQRKGGGGDEGPNIHGSIPPWKDGYHTYSLRMGGILCVLYLKE